MGLTASCEHYLKHFEDSTVGSKSRGIPSPDYYNNEEQIQEQNDIKYLGTKYPFGDNELHMLYTVYNNELLHKYYLFVLLEKNNDDVQSTTHNTNRIDINNNCSNNNNNNNSLISSYFLHDLHRGCYKYLLMKNKNTGTSSNTAATKTNDNSTSFRNSSIRSSNTTNNNTTSTSSMNGSTTTTTTNSLCWANDEEAAIAFVETIRLHINQRLELMDIITNQILPINFSIHYFQSVFALHAATTYTNKNIAISNSSNNQPEIKQKDNIITTTTTTNNDESVELEQQEDNNNNNNNTVNQQEQQQQQTSTKSPSSSLSYPTRSIKMDKYTRKAYLECYFRAISISSRRGSRAAVKAMFVSCCNYCSTDSNNNSSTSTTSTSTNLLDDPDLLAKQRVRAVDLIDIGYRLVLATAYMQYEDNNDIIDTNESNDSSFDPAGSTTTNNNTSTAFDTTTTSNSVNNLTQTKSINDDTSLNKDVLQNDDNTTETTSATPIAQQQQQQQRENHPRNQFLPPPLPNRSNSMNVDIDSSAELPQQQQQDKVYYPLLNAFANSLLAKAQVRSQRFGIPNPVGTDEYGTVCLDDVFEWVDSVAPLFGLILPSFMDCILFPKIKDDQSSSSNNTTTTITNNSRTTFTMPSVPTNSSEFFRGPNSPLLFQLGCLSASLATSTPYHRLYTSAIDGLSFNRLLNCILGYSGPTLFLIKSIQKRNSSSSSSSGQQQIDCQNNNNQDSIFGAYTSSSWKESKDFYGNTDSFLFQLSPCAHVYRPTLSNTNFMYCNSTARSRGYDQQAHGIGFGGTCTAPRLFLDESFENCVASTRDLTYDNGPLLPQPNSNDVSYNPSQSNQYFDIDTLEVWGVGTSDQIMNGLISREQHRSITNEAIRRARKVDKAQFLDDFRSGVIDSKAFQHRQQIDGRADCDVDARYYDTKKNLKM